MKTTQHAMGSDPDSSSGTTSLALTVEPSLVRRFFRILQQGFILRTRLGRSVGEVLFDELGLTREFLDEKVQTLFLNGKTIDDPFSAIVPEGAVIALSSAMPGLVGATLRRGSTYAAMRSQITYDRADGAMVETDGTITVKVYNLLLDELGTALLEGGILIGRDQLADFFEDRGEDFYGACRSAVLGDVPTEPRRIAGILSDSRAGVYDMVRLTVAAVE